MNERKVRVCDLDHESSEPLDWILANLLSVNGGFGEVTPHSRKADAALAIQIGAGAEVCAAIASVRFVRNSVIRLKTAIVRSWRKAEARSGKLSAAIHDADDLVVSSARIVLQAKR